MTSYASPHCMWCQHLREGLTCDGFPERIPDDILESRDGHTRARQGDNGTAFQLRRGMKDEWVGLRRDKG